MKYPFFYTFVLAILLNSCGNDRRPDLYFDGKNDRIEFQDSNYVISSVEFTFESPFSIYSINLMDSLLATRAVKICDIPQGYEAIGNCKGIGKPIRMGINVIGYHRHTLERAGFIFGTLSNDTSQKVVRPQGYL